MINKKIDELKRKRERIRTKIREQKKLGKNPKQLVIEYQDIIKQLDELGVQTTTVASYLSVDYWEDKNNKQEPTTEASPIIQKDVKNEFSLCLAWTSVDGCGTPFQIQKVKDYFNELCLNIEEENNRVVGPGCIEYVLKYKFEGTEDAFRILKICTQFVLDTSAESDFDRFNIAVYGKKRH